MIVLDKEGGRTLSASDVASKFKASQRQVFVSSSASSADQSAHERDDKRKLHMYIVCTLHTWTKPKNETVDEGGDRMLLYKDVESSETRDIIYKTRQRI
jgi:hypothetical protein